MVKAKYDKANNINKMKENIVENGVAWVKATTTIPSAVYTFSFISIYFPSIWSFRSCLGYSVCVCVEYFIGFSSR